MKSTARVFNERTWTATNQGNDAHRGLQNYLDSRSWWKGFLPHREDLTVAGREIKGAWVIPQPLGIALIVFVLGTGATMYWRMGDRIDSQSAKMDAQKELIIRLDEKVTNKAERDREFRQEIKDDAERRAQNQDAMWKVNEKRLAKLEEHNK